MHIWDKAKTVVNRLGNILPEPIRKLIEFKNDEERKSYLESLPSDSLKAILKWFTYVILAGHLLEKTTKLGIELPEQVKEYFERIQEQIKKTGSMTKDTVSAAVDVVFGTMAVAVAIAVIVFGAFLILNPAIAGALFISTLIFEIAISDLISKKDEMNH